jgi:uncharacterized coiled-coil protein SlyX
MSRESDGLIRRIRQMRLALAIPGATAHRAVPASDSAPAAAEPGPETPMVEWDPLRDLEARVAHLEQLVQGLQDSVYRETQRQDRRLAELEALIEPAALATALSKHTRENGL